MTALEGAVGRALADRRHAVGDVHLGNGASVKGLGTDSSNAIVKDHRIQRATPVAQLLTHGDDAARYGDRRNGRLILEHPSPQRRNGNSVHVGGDHDLGSRSVVGGNGNGISAQLVCKLVDRSRSVQIGVDGVDGDAGSESAQTSRHEVGSRLGDPIVFQLVGRGPERTVIRKRYRDRQIVHIDAVADKQTAAGIHRLQLYGVLCVSAALAGADGPSGGLLQIPVAVAVTRGIQEMIPVGVLTAGAGEKGISPLQAGRRDNGGAVDMINLLHNLAITEYRFASRAYHALGPPGSLTGRRDGGNGHGRMVKGRNDLPGEQSFAAIAAVGAPRHARGKAGGTHGGHVHHGMSRCLDVLLLEAVRATDAGLFGVALLQAGGLYLYLVIRMRLLRNHGLRRHNRLADQAADTVGQTGLRTGGVIARHHGFLMSQGGDHGLLHVYDVTHRAGFTVRHTALGAGGLFPTYDAFGVPQGLRIVGGLGYVANHAFGLGITSQNARGRDDSGDLVMLKGGDRLALHQHGRANRADRSRRRAGGHTGRCHRLQLRGSMTQGSDRLLGNNDHSASRAVGAFRASGIGAGGRNGLGMNHGVLQCGDRLRLPLPAATLPDFLTLPRAGGIHACVPVAPRMYVDLLARLLRRRVVYGYLIRGCGILRLTLLLVAGAEAHQQYTDQNRKQPSKQIVFSHYVASGTVYGIRIPADTHKNGNIQIYFTILYRKSQYESATDRRLCKTNGRAIISRRPSFIPLRPYAPPVTGGDWQNVRYFRSAR